MTSVVRVAVGVIRDQQGRVFIARRPPNKHQGNLWEFPGGKIEDGESCDDALARELSEELGIRVTHSVPLITVPFLYPDKHVLLFVREVLQFEGVPMGNEGQPTCWISTAELDHYSFPAANAPIVKAIRLPERVCVMGDFSTSEELSYRLERAIVERGAGMAVLRSDKADSVKDVAVNAAVDTCRRLSIPFVISSSFASELWHLADGLHLRSEHLWRFNERPIEKAKWLGASCHDVAEVTQAHRLGVDYIFLSPVLPTRSHPGSSPLGWARFCAIAAEAGVPVYALGGMTLADVLYARQSGARGVAAVSAFWY